MTPMFRRNMSLLLLALALSGCKAEPEAHVANAHTELRDAIQQPQDKARAAGDAIQQAAEAQRARIEAEAQ